MFDNNTDNNKDNYRRLQSKNKENVLTIFLRLIRDELKKIQEKKEKKAYIACLFGYMLFMLDKGKKSTQSTILKTQYTKVRIKQQHKVRTQHTTNLR